MKLADLYGEDPWRIRAKIHPKGDFDAQEEKVFQVVGKTSPAHVKRIYDWAPRHIKMTAHPSEGKISVYETHKKDLQPEKGAETLSGSVPRYPGGGRRTLCFLFRARGPRQALRRRFGSSWSTLAKVAPCEEVTAILKRVELGAFLPKRPPKTTASSPTRYTSRNWPRPEESGHTMASNEADSGLPFPTILAMFRFHPYSVGP